MPRERRETVFKALRQRRLTVRRRDCGDLRSWSAVLRFFHMPPSDRQDVRTNFPSGCAKAGEDAGAWILSSANWLTSLDSGQTSGRTEQTGRTGRLWRMRTPRRHLLQHAEARGHLHLNPGKTAHVSISSPFSCPDSRPQPWNCAVFTSHRILHTTFFSCRPACSAPGSPDIGQNLSCQQCSSRSS